MRRRTTRRTLQPLFLLVLAGLSGVAGAQSLNKENFREYLHALENVDTETLKNRFFHEDFTTQVGEETMDVAGLLEFESNLKSLADFHFEINQIVADDSGIAIDAIETFSVKQDADVPIIGPARAGERYARYLSVFYGLREGKILTLKANVMPVEKIE